MIGKTKLFAFGMRPVRAVWACALAPMLPLLAKLVTVEAVLEKLVTMVLTGMPP